MARVTARLDDPVDQAIAWLHAVIEDTPVTADDLRAAGVHPSIIGHVQTLTHRPHEPRVDYYRRIKPHPRARRVKLADIADNSDPDRLAALDEATRERLIAKYAKARQALLS